MREVVLSGADLDGQDFQVGSIWHAIWGRVFGIWGAGIPGVTVEAIDLLTGWTVRTVTPQPTGDYWLDGSYALCVPPASYTVRPSRWEVDVYEPPEATLTVTDADARQDFRLR